MERQQGGEWGGEVGGDKTVLVESGAAGGSAVRTKPDEVAFVSVSAWPDSFGPLEVQRAIIESTGMDPVDAHHVAARQPPMVLATMPAVAAADAASVLRAAESFHWFKV